MTDHEAVADVLDGAADYIERHGWTQGAYAGTSMPIDPTTDLIGLPACAVGAMVLSQPLCARGWGAHLEAMRVLDRRIGTPFIPAWNDAPGRTQQEVLDALRGAAKVERALADEVPA